MSFQCRSFCWHFTVQQKLWIWNSKTYNWMPRAWHKGKHSEEVIQVQVLRTSNWYAVLQYSRLFRWVFNYCYSDNFLIALKIKTFFEWKHFYSTERTTTYDPRVDMIQNDDDPSCRDEFPNCNMVLKSKLCGYAYYNENCCLSCRMISNELF